MAPLSCSQPTSGAAAAAANFIAGQFQPAVWEAETWSFIGTVLGFFLPPMVAIVYETINGDEALDAWYPYLPAILIGGFSGTVLLTQAIIYFGIPPILTFGYQVGAIEPAVCTPARPYGLPCLLKGLIGWTLRFLQGRRGCELGSLRQQEMGLMGLTILFFVIFVLAILPGRFGGPHLMRQGTPEEREIRELKTRVAGLEEELAAKKALVGPGKKG